MPDAGDVLRPDSSRRDAEKLGEDRPAPQADIAGNDPANVRETQARLLDGAADGALSHWKIGGDELPLLLWTVPIGRLPELVKAHDLIPRGPAFHHDGRRGVGHDVVHDLSVGVP